MKNQLIIVKAGGKILEDDSMLDTFLLGFSKLRSPKMLVHGGGKIASSIAERLGYSPVMIEGRRVTNQDMLKVVTMTYGGLLNKNLVADLQALNVNAIGLTGADGNLILSNRRPITNEIDYGWVGDPIQVNTDLVVSLLKNGIVPVIAPLTHDGKGNMLNTNADTIASVMAGSLEKDWDVHLVYAFEFNGVLEDVEDSTSVIRHLSKQKYWELKGSGNIYEGMIPKLDNAFAAIELGAKSVRIVSYKSIGDLNRKDYHDFTLIE